MKKINEFLKRINYQGTATTNLESLIKLQTSFLKSVPFENLDIFKNIPLDYSSENVFYIPPQKSREFVKKSNSL
jgi:arylamine N-acetyltransferase